MSPATGLRGADGPARRGRRVGLVILLVPLVEIVVAVLVARWIGAGPTLLVVLAASVLGLVLLRREGAGALRRWRERSVQGPAAIQARQLGDTGLRFAAALLLVIPGLVTGVAGLLLLLPPIRAAVAAAAGRRLRREISRAGGRFTVRGEVLDQPRAGDVRITTWVDENGEPPQLPPAP